MGIKISLIVALQRFSFLHTQNYELRYRRFGEKVAINLTNVQVQILPLPLQLRATTARGAISKCSSGWEKETEQTEL